MKAGGHAVAEMNAGDRAVLQIRGVEDQQDRSGSRRGYTAR